MTTPKGTLFRTCLLAAALAWCAVIFCSPAQTSSTGGSGSETQNSLVVISDNGRLHGAAGPDILTKAYGVFYIPYADSGFDTTVSCGADGFFDFGAIDSGTYNVMAAAAGPASPAAAFIAGIPVGPGIGPDTFQMSLDRVGRVSGTVRDSAQVAYPLLPVYIQGSPFFDSTDATGFFSIHDVPGGDFRLLAKEVISRGKKDTLSANADVSLSAGEAKTIPMKMINK
jgi:hypothetical protein